MRVKSHFARGNLTLRVETIIVHVEITLVSVEITLVHVFLLSWGEGVFTPITRLPGYL
jgi:hypothetical protein